MKRLPKIVRIGCHDYEVKSLPAKVASERHGDCDDDLLEIRIAKSSKRGKKQEILVHESLHGCFYAAPIDWDDIDEERLVTFLAPRVLQWLQDNPDLAEYLRER